MAETVNLKRSYSALNEALVKVFDESGVKRAFTVPYIEGQEMSDHINSVGQAASTVGGLSGNLVMSAHHSSGKGYGSGDGHTVGHPAEKLRQTQIPKDDANAKAAIAVAQHCINNFKFLLGDDDPTVQTAQGQLILARYSFTSCLSPLRLSRARITERNQADTPRTCAGLSKKQNPTNSKEICSL
jgi:hypothetical protein